MPVATADQYAEMLDRAVAGRFAFPAVNVTSSQTLNGVLRGLVDAGSDGIVQLTVGGAKYLGGGDALAWSAALAAMTRELAGPLRRAGRGPYRPRAARHRRRLPAGVDRRFSEAAR